MNWLKHWFKRTPSGATHILDAKGKPLGRPLVHTPFRRGMWVTWQGLNGNPTLADDEKRVGIVLDIDLSGTAQVDQVDEHGLTLLSGLSIASAKLNQAALVEIPESRRPDTRDARVQAEMKVRGYA